MSTRPCNANKSVGIAGVKGYVKPPLLAIDAPGTLEMEFQNQFPGPEELRDSHSVVQGSGGRWEDLERVEKGLGRVGEEVQVLMIRVNEMLAEGRGETVYSADMYVGC